LQIFEIQDSGKLAGIVETQLKAIVEHKGETFVFGPIQRVFIILDVSRHAEVEQDVVAIVQTPKEVFPSAVRARKGSPLQPFGKLRPIHVPNDFIVVYVYALDALVEGTGVEIALEGVDFGEFGHGGCVFLR
jgi:hypothetical protein